jgi:hypothetical protein
MNKKRIKSNALSKYLEANLVMFDSKEVAYSVDDFGTTNEDLKFQDIQSSEARWWVPVDNPLVCLLTMFFALFQVQHKGREISRSQFGLRHCQNSWIIFDDCIIY